MPKVSKETAENVEDHGTLVVRSTDLDGYTVNLLTFVEGQDLTPLLAALPSGRCQCPHWGYILKGRLTVRYDDHEEVIEAGDAFYLPAGHVPTTEPGTEYLQFSPSDKLAETTAAIMRAMQAAQNA
jgi:hypothetical protein